MRTKTAAALVSLAALAGCGAAAPRASTPTNPSTAKLAPSGGASSPTSSSTVPAACTNASVVSSWSVSRRAAQLIAAPVLDAEPAAISAAGELRAGGILLLGSVPPPAVLASRLAAAGVSPGPLVMADEEGGGVQRLVPDVQSIPWPRQMARTMTTAAVAALADNVGTEMRRAGVDVDLAPVLDVDGAPGPSATDPDGSRSFGADPQIAASYGIAFMQGLQRSGVLAVVKHFPGLGGSSGNTDYGPASTEAFSSLQSGGLIAFRRAFAAGARAVMVANATVPGLSAGPASLSPAVIGGLLRSQLGFGGLVLTDSLSAGAIAAAGYGVPAAAAAAVSAGADLVLFGSTLTPAATAALAPAAMASTFRAAVAAIEGAVADGSISYSRLDAAVEEVLAAKGADLCP
jgi:beta-N-acetylhexosaminidase